ncbi:signal peptidase subunit protein [Cryptosporidium felis]|nr:signal peptidase subunit protein [Cryptosporidium felis]
MDSILSRTNIIFCSFIISLACCAFGNFASSFIYRNSPNGKVELYSVLDLGVNPYLKNDQANIAINIDTDLSNEFNWNTNQIFAFVYVSYEQNHKTNYVIVWDDIFSAKKGKTSYSTKGVINKYPIRDVNRNLRNKEFKLNIAFCYMPVVGSISYFHTNISKSIRLPGRYFQYN